MVDWPASIGDVQNALRDDMELSLLVEPAVGPGLHGQPRLRLTRPSARGMPVVEILWKVRIN